MQISRTAPAITLCIILVLLAAVFFSALPLSSDSIAHAQTNNPTQQDSGGQIQGPSCTGLSAFFSPTCWIGTIGQVFMWLFMGATGYLLSVAGLVFNFLIETTVVQFGQFYTDNVADAVELVWSVFRDVANIAIIGGFVFVALSMILGINEFGSKKFVANLIIVAILINFSLFFTKLVIDTSNITATQFNKAINVNQTGTSNTLTIGNLDNPGGVAGAFFNHVGLSSTFDTWDILSRVRAESGSGLTAFIYGLTMGTIFLTAAFVLLYGSFLLVARSVVIIMLLSVSALAFASFAVPKLNSWWSRWINELIRHAFFAPLLMLFLWATLVISEAISKNARGTLGSLISSPTDPLSLASLFNFAVIMGFLFFSIHAAKLMSIRGAGALPDWKKVFGLGLFGAAGITSLGVAMLGRQTVGRGMRRLQTTMLERAAQIAKQAQETGSKTQARRSNLVAGMARRLDAFTKSDMNLANTAAAKAIAGIPGLKGGLAGQTKVGGIVGSDKKRAERYAENAQRMEAALSDDDRQAMKEAAITAAKAGQSERPNVEAEHVSRKRAVDASELRREQKARQYNDQIRELKQAVSRGDRGAQQQLNEARRERESILREEDRKIREARSKLTEAGRALQKLNQEAERRAGETSPAAQFAEGSAHARYSNILGRKMGIADTPDTDPIAKAARKAVSGKRQAKRIKDTFSAAGIEDIVKKSMPKPDDSSK